MKYAQKAFLIFRTLSLFSIILETLIFVNPFYFNGSSHLGFTNENTNVRTKTENLDAFSNSRCQNNNTISLALIYKCKVDLNKEYDIEEAFTDKPFSVKQNSIQKDDNRWILDFTLRDYLENLEIIIKKGFEIAQKMMEFSILPSVKAQTSKTKVTLAEYAADKIIVGNATANLPNGNVVFAWKYKNPNTREFFFSLTIIDADLNILVNEKTFYSYVLDMNSAYSRLFKDIEIKVFSNGDFLVSYRKDYSNSNSTIIGISNYAPIFGVYRVTIFTIDGDILRGFDLFDEKYEVVNNASASFLKYKNRFGSLDILENDNIIVIWENHVNSPMGKIINKFGQTVIPDFLIGNYRNKDFIVINKVIFDRGFGLFQPKVISLTGNLFAAIWIDDYETESMLLMRICTTEGILKTDIIEVARNINLLSDYNYGDFQARGLKNNNFLIFFSFSKYYASSTMNFNLLVLDKFFICSNSGILLRSFDANDIYVFDNSGYYFAIMPKNYFFAMEVLVLGDGKIVFFWKETCKFFLSSGSSLTNQTSYPSHASKFILGTLTNSNKFFEVYSESNNKLILEITVPIMPPIPIFNNKCNNLNFIPCDSQVKSLLEGCMINDKLVLIEGGQNKNSENKYKFQILIFNSNLFVSKSIEIKNANNEEAISLSILCLSKSSQFIVFITSRITDLSEHFIFAQRYDSQGATVGDKILVNQNTLGEHKNFKAFHLKKMGEEKILVFWEYYSFDHVFLLFGRYLTCEGVPISDPLIIYNSNSYKVLMNDLEGSIFIIDKGLKKLTLIMNFEMQKLSANTYFPKFKNYDIIDFPFVLDNGNIVVIYKGQVDFIRIFDYIKGSFDAPIYLTSNIDLKLVIRIITYTKLSEGRFLVAVLESTNDGIIPNAQKLFLQIFNSNGGKIGKPVTLKTIDSFNAIYLGFESILFDYSQQWYYMNGELSHKSYDDSIVSVMELNSLAFTVLPKSPPVSIELFRKTPFNLVFSESAFDFLGQCQIKTFSLLSVINGMNLPEWLVLDSNTLTISGVPSVGSMGEKYIEIVATDELLNEGRIVLFLDVINKKPTAKPLNMITLKVGDSIDYEIPKDCFKDQDGDWLIISLDNALDWLSFDNALNRISGIPKSGNQGKFVQNIVAKDPFGDSATTGLEIKIENRSPKVIQQQKDVTISNVGQLSIFSLEKDIFADDDGDSISMNLEFYDPINKIFNLHSSFITINTQSWVFTCKPVAGNQGKHLVRLTASDNYGGSVYQEFYIVVPNRGIEACTIPDKIQSIGQSLRYEILQNCFVDGDGDILYYSAILADEKSLPSWITFDSRIFYGNPTSGTQGKYKIKVIAKDNFGESASKEFELTILNSLPVANFIPNYSGKIGSPFQISIPSSTFSDSDNDPLTLKAELFDGNILPNWITFNSQTKTFACTPVSGAQGLVSLRIIAEDGFGGIASSLLNINIQNTVPTCKSLSDISISGFLNQEINVGQEFSIDFLPDFCSDQDEDPLTFLITIGNGQSLPNWINFDSSKMSLKFYPKSGHQGSYQMTLTVRDSYGGFTSISFGISIKNSSPSCRVMGNYDFIIGSVQSINFPVDLCNDNDGDALSFAISQENGQNLPNWMIYESINKNLVLNPKSGSQGTYWIKLLVRDNYGGIVMITFIIKILNLDPICKKIENRVISVGELTNNLISANTCSDADQDLLTYSFSLDNGHSLPDWIIFNPLSITLSALPQSGSQGSYLIKVTANDNYGGSSSTKFLLRVLNSDPVVNTKLITETKIPVGTLFYYAFPEEIFSDKDGDSLIIKAELTDGFNFPSWLSYSTTTNSLSGTPRSGAQGLNKLKFTADDGNGGSAVFLFTLNVLNSPPTSKTINNQNALISKSFRFSIPDSTFEDSDGDKLNLKATRADGSTLMEWLNFAPEAKTLSGIPKSGDQGDFKIKITAEDGFGGLISSSFTIIVPNQNPLSKATLPGITTTFVGQNFYYTVPENSFEDPDGDELIYSASLSGGFSFPSWLRFNAYNRTFMVLPIAGSQGTYLIFITVTDKWGGLAQQQLNMTVPNRKLVSNYIADQRFSLDNYFYFPIPPNAFFSEDGNKLYYKATKENGSPLPAWLTVLELGALSGIPPTVETLKIKLYAMDYKGGSAELTFSMTIVSQAASKTFPKVEEVIPDQNITVGEKFQLVISRNLFSGQGLSLNYFAKLINDDPLPTWLTFFEQNFTISGLAKRGDHLYNKTRITIEAKNPYGESAKASFSLEFINRPPVARENNITKTLYVNQEYTIYLSIDELDGDNLRCRLNVEKPTFVELDAEQCKIVASPQEKDKGFKSELIVVVEDGFGGHTLISVRFYITLSDFDYFMKNLNTILAVLSAVGAFYAFLNRRTMIWNIFCFWSRAETSVWYLDRDKSFKLLLKSSPGWLKKINFSPSQKKLKTISMTRVPTRENLSPTQKPESSQDDSRLDELKHHTLTFNVISFKKTRFEWFLRIFPAFDYIFRRQLYMPQIQLEFKDFSISLDDKDKENFRNLIGNDEVKIFVYDETGRVLEKILCRFNPRSRPITYQETNLDTNQEINHKNSQETNQDVFQDIDQEIKVQDIEDLF